MIDWSARAASVFAPNRAAPTARTDERVVSSPLSVPDERTRENAHGLSSVSSVPDGRGSRIPLAESGSMAKRRANREQGMNLPAETAATTTPAPDPLAPVAWTDADIASFTARCDRLIRWGWSEPEAEKLADRLVRRDREHDERVSCIDCRHYRPGRCGNHKAAGLNSPEIGRDLAAPLQHCPGFRL